VTTDTDARLKERVVRAAQAALVEREFVTPIDVLLGLRWLVPGRLAEWRQGRAPYLEAVIEVGPGKLVAAMELFRVWAESRRLSPVETAYVGRSRDRRPLRFSSGGDPEVERAYRTHWFSPDLSDRRRASLVEREGRPPDLVVISPINDWTCTTCGGTGGLLIMEGPGPVCLACAELDHLVFLSRGDAGLTRRAKRASDLSAVVVRFSRSRGRYERQGILVEQTALERAEAECPPDHAAQARGGSHPGLARPTATRQPARPQ
jgi:hypothetical protein